MVAPFWADIDTRPAESGAIHFKVSPTSLIVTWDNVGYYNSRTDKRNTFQVIITNGLDPIIGVGNNTAFYYQDMQWTTGSASGGVDGFGGVPATAGVNKGNTENFIQIGRFGMNSSEYDGPGGETDGVNYLDNQCFNFVVGDAVNLPPSVSGIPVGNTVTLNVGEVITLSPQFIGPEVGQFVTTEVNTRGLCNVDHTVTNGEVSRVNMQITGAACNVGTNVITLTATDNGTPAQTTVINLTVIVNKLDQTIAFDPIPDKTLEDDPFTVSATASSGLPVTFSILSGPATISGNVVTLTGTGEVVVRASQLGDDTYNAAPPVDRAFNVSSTGLESQTITFADIPDMTFGEGPVTLSATASSGLPVSFEVVSGPATVSGNILTITGAGDVTVRAMQAGNDTYSAATPVAQTFTVEKATQTITFDPLPNRAVGDPPFMLNATASSGLPVSYAVVSGPATVSGNMVTLTGAGTVVIRATQGGGDNYNPAAPVERRFEVVGDPVATGGILWEYVMNPPAAVDLPSGGEVRPELDNPTGSRILTSFATPRNHGNNYASRARGYVTAPITGEYVFYVASDDRAELWLSTDEAPENRMMIASVMSHTDQYQYDKYPSQTSAPIMLQAGQRYYIEALHREYRGVDHLSVGWRMPDGTMEQVISGHYLSPFVPEVVEGIVWEYLMDPPAWGDLPSNGAMIPEFVPTGSRLLTSFATPRNVGNQYFSRARGYVVAPMTGDYVFYLAGDDRAELWLSTDNYPANKRMIASVNSHTAQYQYDKYPSQMARVRLQAGQRYYIEALHREYRGVDHLSVGWRMPDGTMEQTISGQYLRPYVPEVVEGIVWEYLMSPPAWGDLPSEGAMIPEFVPTSSRLLTSFATPRNVGNQYFSRARGYVVAPMTGEYTFMLAGDDRAELWLSTDGSPANKRMIASVMSHTGQYQYNRYPSQTSATVTLQAGQRYYIEALHREYRGVDHLSVGWMMPDGTMKQAISGQYLRPYVSGTLMLAGLVTESGLVGKGVKSGETISEMAKDPLLAYPNPFHGELTVEFSLEEAEDRVMVEVFTLHGKLLETLHDGKAEAGVRYAYTFSGERLSTGIYLCRMTYQGKSVVKRIVLAK
ncbi:hypothetical protein GCM10027443_38910 [Pontibacter brevis]